MGKKIPIRDASSASESSDEGHENTVGNGLGADLSGEGQAAVRGDSAADRAAGGDESTAGDAKLRDENNDLRDKYLRTLAEFDNYKKRTLKERADLLKYQGERIFVDLLPIVDTFELALQHADAQPEKLKEGVLLIYRMLAELLGKWEVRAESTVGKKFDPMTSAAISKVPADNVPPQTVISELKKPYSYKDKLIRFGEVVVAEPTSAEEADAAAEGDIP